MMNVNPESGNMEKQWAGFGQDAVRIYLPCAALLTALLVRQQGKRKKEEYTDISTKNGMVG